MLVMFKSFNLSYCFYIGIFLFLSYIRFHGLTLDSVTWDEATYMIAGRYITEGLIPYKDFLELKPPLTFFIYSIPSFIDQNSFIIFRIFGYLFLFLTAIILFRILIKNQNHKISFYLVLLFVSIMNYHFWLCNTTELISLPFLLLSYIFYRDKKFFSSGLMISFATLIRINFSVLVLALVSEIIFRIYKKNYNIKDLIRFGIGGLLPLLLFIIYFFMNDAILDFKISNFDIFIAYSGENTFYEGFYNFFKAIFKLNYFYYYVFLPFTFLIIISFFENNKINTLLSIYIFSISISIIVSGHSYSHHFIQLIPFLIIYLSTKNFSNSNFLLSSKKIILYLSIFISFTISTVDNINLIIKNKNISEYHLYNRVINLIKDQDRPITLLALDYPIIDWKLNPKRITKIIHTPSIFRNTTDKRLLPYIENNIFERNYIDSLFELRPDIIICSVRICEEDRKNYKSEKIKKLISNYKEIYREKDVSRWEYTQTGTIIVYKLDSY